MSGAIAPCRFRGTGINLPKIVAGEADPPVAEQLVSSNALRQRRFRERQTALKAPEQPALPNGGEAGK